MLLAPEKKYFDLNQFEIMVSKTRLIIALNQPLTTIES